MNIKPLLVKIYLEYKKRYTIFNIAKYHLCRALKFISDAYGPNGWKGALRTKCHIVEKGLTMPKMRFGFGQARIEEMINFLLRLPQYKNEEDYLYAIAILKEYLAYHDINNQKLPLDFRSKIEELVIRFPQVVPTEQYTFTEKDYFKDIHCEFPDFAQARHSVRSFDGPVETSKIEAAIHLAMTAPSACNRQPVKCHLFCETSMVQSILNLQTGNNGFGHMVPQLIVLSSDTTMVGIKEYNDSFINAGIFTMNLVYALFYNRIGSCILNWSVLPDEDRNLKMLTGIPDNEAICLVIAIGKPINKFRVALSKRQALDNILIKH